MKTHIPRGTATPRTGEPWLERSAAKARPCRRARPPDDRYSPTSCRTSSRGWRISSTSDLVEKLRHKGINVSRWRILAVLAMGDGITVNELVERAMMQQSALSRALINMETEGYIRRAPRPGDARYVEVFLAPAGRELFNSLNVLVSHRQVRLLKGFSPQETAAAFALIRRPQQQHRALVGRAPRPQPQKVAAAPLLSPASPSPAARAAASTAAAHTALVRPIRGQHDASRPLMVPSRRRAAWPMSVLDISYDKSYCRLEPASRPGLRGDSSKPPARPRLSYNNCRHCTLEGLEVKRRTQASGTAAVLLLCSAAGMPRTLFAQEADTNSIAEVKVTASKRGEQTVLDTPMAIQAITSEQLASQGIVQFADYARSISGLTFEDQGPGDKKYVIRGLDSTGASTTGVYFDDIVVTANNPQDGGGREPDIRLVDMERVEVLKGPQGTLYGASSMSGTIRMITNKPDASKTSFSANAGVSSTDGRARCELHV